MYGHVEDNGFKKIDVTVPLHPAGRANYASGTDPKKNMKKKRVRLFRSKRAKIIWGVVGALAVLILYVGINTLIFLNDAKKTYAQAQIAYDAVKAQNIVLAQKEFVKTKQSITILQKDLTPIGFVGYIPLLGGYYNDVKNLVNASEHGVNAAIITADSLIPYADVLGLKGEKSFASGSAEERITLAIQSLGKVVPKIDTIETELKAAQRETDKVNPNRYPQIWKLKKVHDQLVELKALTSGAVVAVEDGKPLIKLIPELLGEKAEKKYLVVFQNDKELRPTGGFITFYAIFRIDKGIIKVDRAGDIYTLDDSLPSHAKAPEIIAKYLPKVTTLNIRDSNLSPDFVESMKVFNDMYETSPDNTAIDGIIGIDTHFLVSILDILGEVQAGGLTFNSKIDPRCNCPQVVYQLENEITRPVNYVKSNRKGLLAELIFAIMQKALSSSPKEYWGRLTQGGIKDANEKHVLFYLFNKDAQKGIEALNWGGRVKEFSGNYLYINDANFGGAKSNLFVKQSVRIDLNVNSGEVSQKVTIIYKNPQPHSDCNLETGGLCLNATLRNFQRVYVPKGTKLTASKGSQVKVETKEEFEKTYFEAFMTVNPLGTAQITYDYTLPFKVTSKTLPFLIQKQPGTDGALYEVYLNGKKLEEFTLDTDKEINVPVR